MGRSIVLGGEAPDPIGLDLRGVVVGSEGTLGIVTSVLVKLTENPPGVRTHSGRVRPHRGCLRTVSDVIAAGVVPAALEMMDQPMVQAVENFVHAGYPTDAAAVLLAEVAGSSDRSRRPRPPSLPALPKSTAPPGFGSPPTRRSGRLLWKGRKSAFGAVAQAAPDYYLHDTVVPRTKLVEVLQGVYDIADRYDIALLNVFHAGDGNLHPLVAFRRRGARSLGPGEGGCRGDGADLDRGRGLAVVASTASASRSGT